MIHFGGRIFFKWVEAQPPTGKPWKFSPLKKRYVTWQGAFRKKKSSSKRGFKGIPHRKFNSSPLKSYLPNRKVVFQPPFFRGYIKPRVRIYYFFRGCLRSFTAENSFVTASGCAGFFLLGFLQGKLCGRPVPLDAWPHLFFEQFWVTVTSDSPPMDSKDDVSFINLRGLCPFGHQFLSIRTERSAAVACCSSPSSYLSRWGGALKNHDQWVLAVKRRVKSRWHNYQK